MTVAVFRPGAMILDYASRNAPDRARSGAIKAALTRRRKVAPPVTLADMRRDAGRSEGVA